MMRIQCVQMKQRNNNVKNSYISDILQMPMVLVGLMKEEWVLT